MIAGNLLWAKTFGTSGDDILTAWAHTTDGGVVLAGRTDFTGFGSWDVRCYKLDANYNLEWSRIFGGGSWDQCESVKETPDGGFVLAGLSPMFVIKTDAGGNLLWAKRYGADRAFDIEKYPGWRVCHFG